ncbi:hypothetical protein G6F46_006619 [Rhizopus delemar]|uniref:DUF2421 domain-containing protein n=2 Tax=Rhizopus TaxID=4842 RepID=A0A9P6Z2W8_9FUNG|nr:hypothetical protein G6F55_005184 [Rhizopus delemar]KAG1543371.1 hypothetical protein G6F51_006719 [Rhizopus arrhizus]KAG1496752.1 hypothetical protein G6F54_006253 [Rhizopus delemar]KAG1511023.1 hypothetical protein G6F53_006242 [Rhizopus delemar]KAG1525116.1 hypothetical protein G6F52_003612 [Rhizopus delemar]
MLEITDTKRLPRNAAAPIPFPSPTRGFYDGTSSYVEGSLPIPSPSVYSEIDVVLDDGTLQKRTVSLSTLPEDDELIHPDDPTAVDDESQEIAHMPLLSGQKKKSYSSIANSEESSTSNEDSDHYSDNSTRNPFRARSTGGYKPLSSSANHPATDKKLMTLFSFIKRPLQLTPQQKLVLKCSFAYILGCLFTFVPKLNALIGNNRVSSHLVATATVFFNPAKSLGGMVEASLYGWGYTLFAVTVCLGSMVTTDFFVDRHLTLLAHTLSLGFWLAGATFVVAFLKAHWNKPPVATDDDLPEFTANKSLQTAIESHRSSFTSLQKSLQEAKLEVIWNGEMRGCTLEYDAVVKSMQRLAQSVGGLKSSCGLQFEWMKKTKKKDGWNIKVDRHRQKLQNEFKKERQEETESKGEQDGALTEFIRTIRQPLKSLAYTCKQTLLHLQIEFSDNPRTGPSDETLKANLVKAIALFEVSQRQAVQRLNRHRRHHPSEDDSYIPKDDAFLVYFFVFNLMEFARELISLVESVQTLSLAKEKRRGVVLWIMDVLTQRKGETDDGTVKLKTPQFVPNERHKINTLHTPVPKTKWRRIVLRAWRAFSLFKLQKIRYAVKATIAAVLLATPAFLPSTGPWFRQWRMEWALITLMVVMTPTVGGTNLVAIYRIFSTMLGCFVAMFLYLLFPDNMYPLILCTWLFSIPNFWMILHHKHGKFGQFTLLAYNLVMLNKYNDRDAHQVEVTWLALTRCLSILVGVIFGLFVTAYVWPYEARVELRKGVSDLLLRLAWLYQKLVAVYSERHPVRSTKWEQAEVKEQRLQTAQAFLDSELHLQRTLLELQGLLAQTPNEPRLKGAFPVDMYKKILSSCQNITDKFSSLRTVILKDAWFEEVQQDFIMPVSQERREVVGNVLLYFYILASAMRLKTPLPPYLPPAREAWKSLILRLRKLPVVQSKQVLEKDHVYLFYYAYVTVLEDIIRELDELGKNLTLLFGAIVPEKQWDALFVGWDIEQNRQVD